MIKNILLLSTMYSILFGVKAERDKSDFSKDHTIILKGMAAIAILFHHLALQYGGNLFFRFLTTIGHLPTALFFFISGYGLNCKCTYSEKNIMLWRKSISKIVKPFLAAAVIYAIFYKLYLQVAWKQIFVDFFTGELVKYSWFVWELLIWYILFLVLQYIVKNEKVRAVIFFVLAFCMTFAFGFIRANFVWYDICFMFPLGNMCAMLYNRECIKKKYGNAVFAPAGFTMLALGYVLEIWKWNVLEASAYGRGILLIFTNISAAGFCMLIFAFCTSFKMKSALWTKIGQNSYYIYLYQGLCFVLINRLIPDSGDDTKIVLELILLFGIIALINAVVHARRKFTGEQYERKN